MNTFYRNIYRNALLLSVLIALSLSSACAGVAPAPIDGEVEGLFAGTTQWIIDQASRGVKVVGLRAFFDQARQWVVIGTPFQEGYGFTLLDKNTWTALDDPAVVKNLCGNYVNCRTWDEFVKYLLSTGFVEQIVVMSATITQSWYTWVVGAVKLPSSIELLGSIELDGYWMTLPGLPEGYLEYKQ